MSRTAEQAAAGGGQEELELVQRNLGDGVAAPGDQERLKKSGEPAAGQ